LGLPDTEVSVERLRDPVSKSLYPVVNRDAARTPMPWTGAPGAGFTVAGAEPWLPFGDFAAANVAGQRADVNSHLHLTRDLIALRRELDDLRRGAYVTHAMEGGLWAWRRGDSVLVALNLGGEEVVLDGVEGTVRVGTDRARDGESVSGRLALRAWEAVVVGRA
jgi:alpha-glucosidase